MTGKDGVEVGTFFMTRDCRQHGGRPRATSSPSPSSPATTRSSLRCSTRPSTLAVGDHDVTVDGVGDGHHLHLAAVHRRRPASGARLQDRRPVQRRRLADHPAGQQHFYTLPRQVTYFCYVANPGKDETGNPKFDARAQADRRRQAGRRAAARAGDDFAISDRLFMFGSGLPLSAFTRPAEYKLELTLPDKVTKVSRTSVVVVVIPATAAAPPRRGSPAAAK